MGEPKRQERRPDDSGPPTISMTELWSKTRSQELDDKLFTFGGFVFAVGSLMPFDSGGNAWQYGGMGPASLVVWIGLVVHLLGLVGIGPGGSVRYFKVYRWAGAVAALVFLVFWLGHIFDFGQWQIGFWLCTLAMPIHVLGLYRILEKRALLPFRITK